VSLCLPHPVTVVHGSGPMRGLCHLGVVRSFCPEVGNTSPCFISLQRKQFSQCMVLLPHCGPYLNHPARRGEMGGGVRSEVSD